MTSTLIDTNVFIDMLEQRPRWFAWATARVEQFSQVINQIAYGEASIPYDEEAIFAKSVDVDWIVREDLPWSAAYRAGKAFQTYKERGGQRDMILPDFFIGAHASVKGYRILTRVASRYRTYFPDVEVIAPDTHP